MNIATGPTTAPTTGLSDTMTAPTIAIWGAMTGRNRDQLRCDPTTGLIRVAKREAIRTRRTADRRRMAKRAGTHMWIVRLRLREIRMAAQRMTTSRLTRTRTTTAKRDPKTNESQVRAGYYARPFSFARKTALTYTIYGYTVFVAVLCCIANPHRRRLCIPQSKC